MSTYVVTRKADGVEVYRYSADEPIEWVGFEFATHDHALVVEPTIDPPEPSGPRRLTKLDFIERLGDVAFATILTLAKQSLEVEVFVERFKLTTPDPDGTSVHLDDPRTVAGVTAIGGVLQQMGVVDESWVSGVLNG